MKSLEEYLHEYIENSAIFEQAFNRKIIRYRAGNLDKQILLHLAKIHLNFNKLGENKHINDVSSWIYDIYDMTTSAKARYKMSDLILKRYTTTTKSKVVDDSVISHVVNRLAAKYPITILKTLDNDFVVAINTLISKIDSVRETKDALYIEELRKLIKDVFVK